MTGFLIDVHLPISLSKFLDQQLECYSIHVNQILQRWNTTDNEISKYAYENKLILITKDNDFKDSHFIKYTPKKVIKVALGNIANKDLLTIFEKYLSLLLPLILKDTFYLEISKEQILIID